MTKHRNERETKKFFTQSRVNGLPLSKRIEGKMAPQRNAIENKRWKRGKKNKKMAKGKNNKKRNEKKRNTKRKSGNRKKEIIKSRRRC